MSVRQAAGAAPTVRAAAVACVVVVCALVVPVATGPAHPALAVLALVLLVATATAFVARSPAAIRLALFADLCLLAVAVGGIAVWPAPVLVALGVLWLLARRWPALGPVAPWLRRGRTTPDLPWSVGATVALSATALVAYAVLGDPTVSPYRGVRRGARRHPRPQRRPARPLPGARGRGPDDRGAGRRPAGLSGRSPHPRTNSFTTTPDSNGRLDTRRRERGS